MMDRTNQSLLSNSKLDALCFKSLNNSCPKIQQYPPIIRVFLYALVVAIILLTVLGNLLVVIIVLHFKQLHTPTNFLILSLAVADLLVGALVMPFFMVFSIESCWYTGNIHCKIQASIDLMLCFTSVLNLCFIAVDRYIAVCHPLRYQTTITRPVTAAIVLFLWSFAAMLGFCSFFLAPENTEKDRSLNVKMCEGACPLFSNKLAAVTFLTLGIYCPGLIMVCIYIKIYTIAKKQARLIQQKHRCVEKSNVASKTEIKATKTLAIVMGVFLSLWLPLYISNLIYLLPGSSSSLSLSRTFSWMATLNSTCNPIVYALFYSWFRRAFKIIVSGKVFQTNSSCLNLLDELN